MHPSLSSIRKVRENGRIGIKLIEEPLFPSYIFVKIQPIDQYRVCSQREVVRFVTFGSKPVEVKELVVQSLISVSDEKEIEVTNGCSVERGDSVEITEGQLCGLRGYVTEKASNNKVSICVEALNRTVTVTLPVGSVLITS